MIKALRPWSVLWSLQFQVRKHENNHYLDEIITNGAERMWITPKTTLCFMHSVPFDSVSHVLCKYLAIQQFSHSRCNRYRQDNLNSTCKCLSQTLPCTNIMNGTERMRFTPKTTLCFMPSFPYDPLIFTFKMQSLSSRWFKFNLRLSFSIITLTRLYRTERNRCDLLQRQPSVLYIPLRSVPFDSVGYVLWKYLAVQ